VTGLFQAEGLVGDGAHHERGVRVGVCLDRELEAEQAVLLGCVFMAEVEVCVNNLAHVRDGRICPVAGCLGVLAGADFGGGAGA
jgi:hypothetical protein